MGRDRCWSRDLMDRRFFAWSHRSRGFQYALCPLKLLQQTPTSVRFAFGNTLMIMLLVCSEVLFKWFVSRCRSGSLDWGKENLWVFGTPWFQCIPLQDPVWIKWKTLSSVNALYWLFRTLLIYGWCSAGLLYLVLFRYTVNLVPADYRVFLTFFLWSLQRVLWPWSSLHEFFRLDPNILKIEKLIEIKKILLTRFCGVSSTLG